MSSPPPSASAFRVSELSGTPRTFALRPAPAQLKDWSNLLGLLGLRKVSFSGEIRPTGDRDWMLEANLGATVEQTCSVTLDPVRTRIETRVTRRFIRDFELPDVPEIEMTEDDTLEPLGQWIDPEAVLLEALSLELPQYPRAQGIAFDGLRYAEDGVTPLTDEAARPFAALAGLKQKMEKGD